MSRAIALHQFNEAKGREIIPITPWCFWKLRNLMVFDGYKGSNEEAMLVVSRMVMDVLRHQVEEIHTHSYVLLETKAEDSVFQRMRGWL